MNPLQHLLFALAGGLLLLLGGMVARGLWHRALRVRTGRERQRRLRTRLDERIHVREREQVQYYREVGWEGFRRFVVERKEIEDRNGQVMSFYLAPEDGRSLRDFHPGQFLTFRFLMTEANGTVRPVVRCYSLSCGAADKPYRISVKRVPPPPGSEHPPGLVSGHLHDSISVGDIIDVKPPAGDFWLDPSGTNPVVLIGGGIGITPVYSMLRSCVEAGGKREIWLFYGVRHGTEHVFKSELEAMAEAHDNVHVVVCYSDPQETEVRGRDYHEEGRIGVELFERLLPGKAFDFYLCGPPPMMRAIVEGLDAWGIPEERVHFEAFGPASIRRKPKPVSESAEEEVFAVEFEKSASRLKWDGTLDNLLALAEGSGVPILGGCRAGNCGTCAVTLKKGEVSYVTKAGAHIEPGTCLTCITIPASDLVLDA